MSAIWLLLGRNAGDNAQARALAAEIGGAAREIALAHNLLREIPAGWRGGSLVSLTEPPGFAPPWPRLVIGVGRRNAPVARWIAEASAGVARLLWIGRPRAPLGWFDLVLTTAQYGLPAAANVLTLALPFAPEAPEAAPRRALALLGGPSWAARTPPAFLDAFAGAAERLAAETGLPLTILTSPRSPDGAGARLAARIPGAEVFDFRAAKGAGNPYRARLAEAGAILVSGDSVSLLSDAAATGAPVSLLPAPEPGWLRAVRATGPGRRWLAEGGNRGLLAPPPNLPALHETLVARGLARWEGGLLRLEGTRPALAAERAEAVRRARGLIAG